MKQRHTLVSLFCLVGLLLLSFASTSVYSQTATRVLSGAEPRHETLNQRVISVLFDDGAGGAITLTGATIPAQWVVRLNGSAVGIVVNSTTIAGNRVNVLFDASGAAGHLAGENFIKPGEAVTISFTNAGNTLTTGVSGNPAASFAFIASKNNYANLGFPPVSPICGEFVFFNLTDYGNVDKCAPVVMNFRQIAYKASLRLINSSAFALYPLRYNTVWGDGTPTDALTPVRSDLTGVPNATFINNVDPGFANNPAIVLTARPTHNYPASTTPAPDICSWDVKVTPTFNGNAFCNSIAQTTVFASYDTDNANTGSLNMPFNPPAVGETTDRVCLGTNVNMRFTDQTLLNCRLAAPETGVPNDLARHIRIIYGSRNIATNIPDVRVAGVPVTANDAAGTHLFAANPLYGGQPGYFPTGAGGVGVPDANGVIELPVPVLTSTLLTYMKYITTVSAANHAVGDQFFVKLEYWDVCNPYKDPAGLLPSPFTPAVSIENFVQIVTKPVPLTTAGLAICYTTPNSTAFNFTAASSLGGARTGVNWYKNLASVGTATKMANGVNNLSFPAASYGAQGGIGGAFTSNNTNGRYHSVWATQLAGAVNTCESDPVEVVIVQQPRIDVAPDIPSTPVGNTDVCNGPPAVNEVYTTSAPNIKTIPITTSTNGAAINLPTENIWSVSGFAATVTNAPSTGNSTTVTYNIAVQPNPLDNGNVSVRRGFITTGPSPIQVVSPLPAPAVVPTYAITPLACLNANVNLSVDVYGQSNGGTISPNYTICNGSLTGNISVAGSLGVILQWERQFGAGAFVSIGNAGLTTITDTPPNGPGTYHYRVLVQNQGVGGPCAAVTTIVANQNTVTVNPIPAKPTITPSGATTFCFGGSVTLSSSNVNAATYQWYKDGLAVGGATAQTYIINTVAQSGSYTVETRGIAPTTCLSPMSDPTVVTVNPLPTASNPTGGGSVCSGNPAPDIVWTLTGTPPFNFTITRSVQGPLVVVGHNSLTYTIVAPNPPASQTYQITSLTDANGCVATSMGGVATVNIQLIPPPSVESFNATAAVCDDGAPTNPPDAILNLLPNSVETYDISYTVNGVPFTQNGVPSDAAGQITLSPPYTAWGSVPGSFVVTVTALKNTVTLCAGAVPFNSAPLVVNARPAAPTGPVGSTYCSSGGPTAISVTNPGAGFTIDWYAAASGGLVLAGGTGTSSFIPPSNGTYFAETRNTVTGCTSTTRTSVVSTIDNAVAAANAGPDQLTLTSCAPTPTLAGNAIAGGVGAWSIPGKIAYYQNFTAFANGTTSSSAANGWTRDVSGPNAFPQNPAGGYFEVRNGPANPRFEAQNTNGNRGAGAPNQGEVVWFSSVIDISAIASVTATVDVINVSAGLSAPDDNVGVFYKLNGGAEIAFTTNGSLPGNFANSTASVSGLAGATLQVVVRVRNDGAANTVAFDNVVVRDVASGGISFVDANSPTTTVTGLPSPAAGTPALSTTLRWTASTALGVCPSTSNDVVITINPAPLVLAAQTTSVCSGNPVNYEIKLSPVNFPAGSTLTWPDPDGAGPATAKTINADPVGTFHITDVLTNTSGANINVTYAVTPRTTVGAGCNGAPVNVVVTVRPAPVVTAGQTKSICSGDAVNYKILLNPAGLPATTRFTWPAPTMSVAPAQGTGNPGGVAGELQSNALHITDVLTNNTGAPITATYNITPFDGTCFGTVVPVVITINPLPVANPIVGQAAVCIGPTTVLYQVTPNAGSTYNWVVPAPFVKFGGGTPTDFFVLVQFPAVGTANITMTETNSFGCVGAVNTFGVTASAAPGVFAIAGLDPVCQNQTGVTYSVPPASLNATSTYNWTASGATIVSAASGVGLGTITVDFGLATSAIISVSEVSTSGCSSAVPISKTVTVGTNPAMTSANSESICSGATTALVFTANPASTFSWKITNITGAITSTVGGFGVGKTGIGDLSATFAGATALTNTSAAVGSVSFDVTPTSSCAGATQNVVITVNPKPAIPDQTPAICSGTAFTVAPADGVPTAATIVPFATTYTWGAPVVTGGVTGGSAQAVGQPSISQTLTNPTNTPQTVTYTVTPKSGTAGSCVGSNFTITVTVNPKPLVGNQTATICSGGTFAITPVDASPATIVPAGTTYTWTAPVVSGGLTGGSAQAVGQPTISQTLTNPTNVPQTAMYAVTPISGAAGACVGPTFTITVTVNPKPVIGNQTPSICSGTAFTVSPVDASPATIVPAGTTYTWGAPVVTGGITGGSAQAIGQPTISQTLTNPTNVPQTATYTVTPTSGAAGACVGANFTITVTVNPKPVIPAQASSICSGTAFTVTPADGVPTAATIVPAGTTYTWALPVVTGGVTGGSAMAVGQPTISQTLTNPTNVPQTATYTVTPTSGAAGTCAGSTFTVTVTVNPKPVIANQTATICSATAFTITPADGVPTAATIVPAGTTYSWAAPVVTGGITGGSAQAGLASISQTLTNPTNIAQTATYTVTPTSGAAGSCVGSTFTVTVTVNPKPVIAAQTATVCSGTAFTISPIDGVPGGTVVPAGTTYSWAAPVVTGGVTGGSAQAGQASVSQTLTNPTNVPQTATYTVTPTSGAAGACVGSNFTVTVTINTKPVIPVQTATICSGTAFTISPTDGVPTSSTIVPAGTTYSWAAPVVTGGITGGSAQAGQATISQLLVNPTNSVQTATYTVTPTSGAAGSCVGTNFTITVTVNPKPVIAAQIATICSGTSFTINPSDGVPTSATIVPGGTTYTWPAPAVTGGITGTSAQAGQPFISQILTNPTNTVQTATYTVTPTSGASGSCVGSNFTITVTVDPKPVIANQTATICSGSAFTIAPTDAVPTAATIVPAGTTYTWPAPVVTGGVTGASAQTSQPSISQTLTNPTNLVQTVTYTVTPTSGAAGTCVGATFTITVTVDPVPVIPAQTASICSGTAFTINPANAVPTAATIVPGGTTYSWAAPAVTGGITGGSAQAGQPNISQTLANPTNTAQTATYTVTPTSGAAGACVGATFTVTVTVNPVPVIANRTATVCSGVAFSITPADGVPTAATVVPGGTTYTWAAPVVTGGLTGGSGQTGQNTISQTLSNPTNVAQTATYTVTPTSGVSGACVGANFTVTITVDPKPAIPAQTASICSGTAFTVSPTDGVPTAGTIVPVGTTYSWGVPVVTGGITGGSAQAGQASVSQTLTNPTNASQIATYTVTPLSGSCTGPNFTVLITVDPKPAIPAQVATVCSDAVFTVTPVNGVPTAATVVPAGTTYTWAAPVVTGGITGGSAEVAGQPSISQTLENPTNTIQTATYNVTPTGAAGCVGNAFTVTVTVNPQPEIDDQTTTICSGTAFSITPANGVPTAATIVPAGTKYTWSAPVVTGGITGGSSQAVGQLTISQTLTNPTNVSQTATYTVIPTSGAAGSCVGSTFTVTVTVDPKPFVPAQTASICSGTSFSISPVNGTPTAATIVPAGTTYTWPAPVVTGGITGGAAQAVGQPLISETLTNPTNVPQTATYTVTPTSGASGGCIGATFTITVTVNPQPVIPAQIVTVCSGSVFTVNPANGVPTAATIVPAGTTYTWAGPVVTGGLTGGTGQTAQNSISQTLINPTNTAQTATYTVTPTSGAAGTCIGSAFTVTVTVDPKPTIPAQTATICSGTAFTVNPADGVPTAATIVPAGTTYSWAAPVVTGGITGGSAQAGQISVSQTLTNPTSAPQIATYTVTPLTGACTGATFTVLVTVNPKPAIPAQVAAICSGATFTITPSDGVPTAATIVPGGTTYTWAAPVVTGGITGGSAQGVGQPSISQTLTNPTNTLQTAVYTVTPTSGAGSCVGAPFTITVTVNPKPAVPDQTATICSGGTFSITPANGVPTAATIVPGGTTYTWGAPVVTGGITGGSAQAVGQPAISQTLTNPTNVVQTATYTVTPTSGAAGSCVGSTFTVTVTVNPQPVIPAQTAAICSGSAFTINPTNGIPTSATIVPAATTYTWAAPVVTGGITGGSAQAVGQPQISQTLTNPTNIVQTATYTVTPTSGAAGGCIGATFTITVTVNPKPIIPAQVATTCSGTVFVVSPADGVPTAATIVPAGTTYAWPAPVVTGGLTGGLARAGQASVSQTLTNPTNIAQTATYTVTPTSGASGSCVGATFVVTVTVDPKPAIPAQTATICSGNTFTVSPADGIPTAATIVPAGTTYSWPAPVVTGGITGSSAQAGQVSVSQTLSNPTSSVQIANYTVTPLSGGCTGATFTVLVTVNPEPAIPAQTSTICSGSTFTVTPVDGVPAGTIVPGGTTYTWAAPVVTGGITGGSAQAVGQPSVSQTLTNPTNTLQTATYTVTPTSGVGACAGPTFTVAVTVNPKPVIPAQTAAICSGAAFTVSPANGVPTAATIVPAGTTYSWSAPVVTGGVTGGSAQTAQASISQNLVNPTNTVQTATYNVTPTSGAAGSCVGSNFTITVTVNPQPVIPAQTATICSGGTFSIGPVNAAPVTIVPGGTTYSWPAPVVTGGITGGSAQAGQLNISQTLTNPTNLVQTATYTVTPTSGAAGSCVGAPFTVTITVNPQPFIVAQTATICSGTAFTISPTDGGGNIVPAGTTYTWNAPVVTGGITGGSAQGGQASVSQTLTSPSSVAETATYTVTPTSGAAGNCVGPNFTVTVTVNPKPVAQALSSIARCSGVAINFDLQDIINNVAPFVGGNSVPSTFSYTVVSDFPLDLAPAVFPGTFDRPIASAAPISQTFSNYSNHDVTLTYTVTPFSNVGNCPGTPFTFKVVYHPEPVGANFTEPNCNTSLNHSIQTQITNGLTSRFTYVVASSDEAAVPTQLPTSKNRVVASTAPITDSYTNLSGSPVTVTYTITAFNDANPTCAGAAIFTYTVTISPKPVGVSDTKPAVCSDVAFSVDPQLNIVPAVASTFTWTATYDGVPIPGGTGVINASFNNVSGAVKNAVYTITPTASGSGCAGLPFTITIPINSEPVMDPVLANPAAVCSTNPNSNNPINVILNTVIPNTAANYVIASRVLDPGLTLVAGAAIPGTFVAGGGGTSNAIQNDTYANTTAAQLKAVYTVTPVSAGGCSGNSFTITMPVNPEPVISTSLDNTVCSDDIANITLSTNGTSVTASTYTLIAVTIPPGATPAVSNTPVNTTGSATLIKNDKYTNNTANPVTVIYEVRGTSPAPGSCLGQSRFINLQVNPGPVLNPALAAPPPIACSGLPSGVNLSVGPGSVAARPLTGYNIISIVFPGLTADPGNTGVGNGKDFTAIANDKYINATNGPLTVTYSIAVVSAAGCVGPIGTAVLNIGPSPDLANNLGKTVCSGSTSGINLSIANAVAMGDYNLISITKAPALVANGGNVTAGPGKAANALAGDIFTNPTNGVLTVIYSISPRSAINCFGPAEDVVLTVEPTVTATPAPLNSTVCSNSGSTVNPTNITLTSPTVPTAGNITFNYSASVTSGSSTSGFVPSLSNLAQGYIIQDNIVNSSNTGSVVTYNITPVANGARGGLGCSGTPVSVTVGVEPKPKLVATPTFKTVCEGVSPNISLTSPTIPSVGSIQFLLVTAVSTGGVTGASPNGTVFANGSTISDLLSNPTTIAQTVTYTLRPRMTAGACIGDDVTVTVTVNPRPTITASAQAPICSGGQVDITLTPDVLATVSTWTVAATANITGAGPGAGDRIFSVLFNNGTAVETVTYTVTPQASGCAGTPLVIPVTVNPVPKVNAPATVTVCHGATLTVPLTSTIDPLPVTYAWTVSPNAIGVPLTGSGATISQPMTNTQGFQETLTYSIVATGPGGCDNSFSPKLIIVTVSPQITAAFLNSPSPDFICKGSTEYLIFQFGGSPLFNFTYNKGGAPIVVPNKGNVAVIQDIPLVTTTYTITSVTDGFGCTSPFNVPLTVNVGDTDPNYSIISPLATCSPNRVSFQYNQVAGTIYTWRFGDSADSTYTAATTVANKVIKHTYTNLSPTSTLSYPVSMQTELPAPFPGCFKTTPPKTVTIYPNVITNVLPDKTEICSGESIFFSNQSVGTTGQTWSYRVQGQVPETVMGNSLNINFAFTNNTPANPIIYEVIYRGTNLNCPAPDVIIPIKVYRSAVAGFNEGIVPSFINGESNVTFTNTTVPVDPVLFTYDWIFGTDAQPLTFTGPIPPTVKYTRPGQKTVTLTVTNVASPLCKSTFEKAININLPPLVAYFAVDPKESCYPAVIKVRADSTMITGDIIDWKVYDNNGRIVATSSGALPQFTMSSPGEFLITLVSSSSITGQTTPVFKRSVTVFDKPFNSFDVRPDVVYIPDTELTLFNFSTGANKYSWDFGDGDTIAGLSGDNVPSGTHNGRTGGTIEEPTHIYKVEGSYDLTLIALNDHGNNVVCADTLSHKVLAKQGGVAKIPNAFTPSPYGPSGGGGSGGGGSGGGGSGGGGSGGGGAGTGTGGTGSFNDVFLPYVKGVEEFNMQIYDRWGNLIFESNDQRVGWDGYDKDGRILPAGVYVYKLTIRLSDGQRSTQIGDVTMIR